MALDRQCLRLSSLKTTQVGEAYRIAISANRGAHWTFVDPGLSPESSTRKIDRTKTRKMVEAVCANSGWLPHLREAGVVSKLKCPVFLASEMSGFGFTSFI